MVVRLAEKMAALAKLAVTDAAGNSIPVPSLAKSADGTPCGAVLMLVRRMG
jgi:hypothetical protein